MLASDVFRALENAGEVKLSIAEHRTSTDNNTLSFSPLHDVAFVLDPPGKKRKKAWPQMS